MMQVDELTTEATRTLLSRDVCVKLLKGEFLTQSVQQ
jgi:hypothetical protein